MNMPIARRDLLEAAGRLDVPLASIAALKDVESRGQGFLPDGRPTLLYERHIMYRRLHLPNKAEDVPAQLQQRAEALARTYPSLVNPKPGGYVGGAAEHERLARAREIDDERALESASWGAFQVMGFHWSRLGYANVTAFVEAMQRSETDQLEAFVRFIETDAVLHRALKAQQWSAVAKRYNGPDYRRNQYDTKLQQAYERHRQADA
ncbi:N-acetylmuramidase family protein [Pseudomonas entomophila]|nr:N-acetylmuramidase family protein [Pseudomonas entomophila]